MKKSACSLVLIFFIGLFLLACSGNVLAKGNNIK